jgi:extracellular factor (EF) 3-hydroxypalmitic acid methyl ester biosynthesis protein
MSSTVANATSTINPPVSQSVPASSIQFRAEGTLIGSLPLSDLDIIHEQLEAGWIARSLDELMGDLNNRREDPQDWAAYAESCRKHPLCGVLHQDPFTYRAFAKPRGYAGDAVMMDYIYGLGEAPQVAKEATPLGRAIFRHLGTRQSAKAVRYRRQLLAKLIDRVAAQGGSSVLAIAAGHLREVELSEAVQSGKIGEFVALDQDEASLSVVHRDYARLGVRTVPGSVRQILAGKANLGQYDFVYAAGLFDYLSAPVAAAFANRMLEMTRPGGMVLIPNFLTRIADRGYMESFMDWHLIYRDHSDMRALATALPTGQVSDYQISDDPENAITYLLVSKVGGSAH